MKKNIFIILNNDLLVTEWQYKCLLKIKNQNLVFLISNELKSKNSVKFKRNYFKNFLYYIINIISIRQKMVKVKFNSFKNSSYKKIFFITKNNSWEELNKESIEEIILGNPSLIYKCGMGLLYINKELKNIPIISHHHGDPTKFRGRPAGFYELLKGEKKLGQIVQLISNKLDSGKILSYGETKIYPWSYKKTINESFKISPIIFEKALISLEAGNFIDKKSGGKNYKLPSNKLSIFFIYIEISNLFKKLFYGLFWEKFWQVGYLNKSLISKITKPDDFFKIISKTSKNFKPIKIFKDYSFYADPFILDSNIFVEGLKKSSLKGDLLLIDINKNSIIKKLTLENKHLSYPYTIEFSGKKYIYPDSGALKNPIFYSGTKTKFLKKSFMNKFKSGLTDPTVIKHNGLYYLFANIPNEQYILRLWYASNPEFNDPKEHPNSPICITPEGGRSGGRIFKFKKNLYRYGQQCSSDYGNGLILFRIETLSERNFFEKKISTFKLNKPFKGPHNIDFCDDLLTWDYYTERFNLFAGFNRIMEKF